MLDPQNHKLPGSRFHPGWPFGSSGDLCALCGFDLSRPVSHFTIFQAEHNRHNDQ
jgi:hypothetical protein